MSVGGCTRAVARARISLRVPVVTRMALLAAAWQMSWNILSSRCPVLAEMNRMGA